MKVIWIDEDASKFPAVERLLRMRQMKVEREYSVADGIRRMDDPALREHAVVLLDLLVLGGENFDEMLRERGIDLATRPQGLAVILAHPDCRARTVLLSVLSRTQMEAYLQDVGLERDQFPQIVEKKSLIHGLAELGAAVDSACAAAAIH